MIFIYPSFIASQGSQTLNQFYIYHLDISMKYFFRLKYTNLCIHPFQLLNYLIPSGVNNLFFP